MYKRLILVVALMGPLSLAATPPAAHEIARWLFNALEVRRIPCPAYTFQGGLQPRCGATSLDPEAFAEAVDRLLERTPATKPGTPWTDDHGVRLRYFERGGARYALLYTPLDATFNVQLVRVE